MNVSVPFELTTTNGHELLGRSFAEDERTVESVRAAFYPEQTSWEFKLSLGKHQKRNRSIRLSIQQGLTLTLALEPSNGEAATIMALVARAVDEGLTPIDVGI